MAVKPELSEKQIRESCCAVLEADGWRRLRMSRISRPGLTIGEKGMADDLFIRYYRNNPNPELSGIMWVEWKKVTGKLSAAQNSWIIRERMRGAKVYVAGQDFACTIEAFREWYRRVSIRQRGMR